MTTSRCGVTGEGAREEANGNERRASASRGDSRARAGEFSVHARSIRRARVGYYNASYDDDDDEDEDDERVKADSSFLSRRRGDDVATAPLRDENDEGDRTDASGDLLGVSIRQRTQLHVRAAHETPHG